jgi:hypothetical protein
LLLFPIRAVIIVILLIYSTVMKKDSGLKEALSNEFSAKETSEKEEKFAPMVKKSMKQQAAFIVSFVIFAVLIGGSVFAYKQFAKNSSGTNPIDDEVVEEGLEEEEKTTFDYSDWETYSNDLLGIEFKYPKDWIFSQQGDYSYVVSNSDVLWGFATGWTNYFDFAEDIRGELCYTEYNPEVDNDYPGQGDFICVSEVSDDEYQLLGIDAVKVKSIADSKVYFVNFENTEVPHGPVAPGQPFGVESLGNYEKPLALQYVLLNETSDIREYEEILDAMTKSIRYITEDNEEVEETTGWSTYRSPVYKGMKLKYPSNWKVVEKTVHGIEGFEIVITNGEVEWYYTSEYQGVLSPTPTIGETPFDWCVWEVFVFPIMEHHDIAYPFLSDDLVCSDMHSVIWYQPVDINQKDDFTEEEFLILNRITESLEKE